MSKYKQCYYVMTLHNQRVISRITDEGLFGGYSVHSNGVSTIGTLIECTHLKDAKKLQKENGGIILKGMKDANV